MIRTAAALIAVLVSVSIQAAASSGTPTKASDLEYAWQLFAKEASGPEVTAVFPYGKCFKAAAQVHGLPEILLLAVARGESAFDPLARSSANAYGLMQILWPGTARHLGIESRKQLLDPCTNVDAGARYLRELLNRYGGNLHRALGAYNYGPARVPVSGGVLPAGAVRYSGYIKRHLDNMLASGTGSAAGRSGPGGKLLLIRFKRRYRAAAYVDSLQPMLGDVRLGWRPRPGGWFDVLMVYDNASQMAKGKRRLSQLGITDWQRRIH
jgi:hypothetical protein